MRNDDQTKETNDSPNLSGKSEMIPLYTRFHIRFMSWLMLFHGIAIFIIVKSFPEVISEELEFYRRIEPWKAIHPLEFLAIIQVVVGIYCIRKPEQYVSRKDDIILYWLVTIGVPLVFYITSLPFYYYWLHWE